MLKRTRIILDVIEDRNLGGLGFAIPGMPRNDSTNPGNGLQVAHDLIEHVNGAHLIGTIDDELEAIGAIWYVRAEIGDLTRDGTGIMHSPEHHAASDISRMFVDYINGHDARLKPARTTSHYCDSSFKSIIAIAARMAMDETHDAGDQHLYRAEWGRFANAALAGLRTGYRKAYRKYEKHGRHYANRLFWEIEEAVRKQYKNLGFEGQQFALCYGGPNPATCWEVTYDEET